MTQNKEVRIAIIVGIIMVSICLLAFIFAASNKNKVSNIDLKVYKLYDLPDNKHEYRACKITTENLITISGEYKSIQNLTEENRILGKQINGNYKIILAGSSYIAFDADETNYVYRSLDGTLYEFKSSLYDYVKELCD